MGHRASGIGSHRTDLPGNGQWLSAARRNGDVFLFVLFWGLILLFRVRLLWLPFERDEGEYAYGGQLILQGLPIYQHLYTLKWPGTHLFYALIMVLFGQTVQGIHLGLLLVNSISAGFFVLLARRWLERPYALFATGAFLVLTLSPAAHGVIANAEHFAMFWLVPGLYFLDRAIRDARMGWGLPAGICLALGAVCKQPSIMLVGCAGMACLVLPLLAGNWRRAAGILTMYLCGVGIVFASLVSLIFWWGVWDDFVFWTMTYARDYTSQIQLRQGAWIFYQALYWVIGGTWPIYVLSLGGLLTACLVRPRGECLVLMAFWCASLCALSPGLYFRPHYFLFMAPVTALLAGLCVQAVAHWLLQSKSETAPTVSLPRRWMVWVTVCTLSLPFCLFIERFILIRGRAAVTIRYIHGDSQFQEAPVVGAYLKQRMKPEDRLFILGSDPQLCFYSQRHSATSFVYLYPFFERHPHRVMMQAKMIEQVEAAHPDYVVMLRTHPFEKFPLPDWEGPLPEWMPRFLADYALCGYALAGPGDESTYVFDLQPGTSVPDKADIKIYHRMAAAVSTKGIQRR